MAYTWEPRWEPYMVKINGIVFKTCRDKITGMIACPICINARARCLGESDEAKYNVENSFFFRVEDLIKHIKNYHGGRKTRHYYRGLKRK